MQRKFKARSSRVQGRVVRIQTRLLRLAFFRFAFSVIDTLGRDYVGIMAAGLSYYGFLSLFPMVIGLISILGYLLPSEDVYNIVFSFLQRSFPVSIDFIQSTIQSVIQNRGTLGIISIAGLIFGGTAILSGVSVAVNRAWGLPLKTFFIRKPKEIVMVLSLGLIILILFFASTGLSVLSSMALPNSNFFQAVLIQVGSFAFLFVIFLLLYKFTPSIHVRWADIWRGSLAAAAGFRLAFWGFTIFLQYFASYELIYGSLASLVIILVWIYISSYVLMIGAEINVVYNEMFKWHTSHLLR